MLQKDVAAQIGISEDCLIYWENNRSTPQVKYYPKIIAFLAYFPFDIRPLTLAQKITHYRYWHGLTQEELAQILNVNESTVFRYEKGGFIHSKKVLKKLAVLIGDI